jgi:hypothetical protein
MPSYDFHCKTCSRTDRDVVMPITRFDTDRPLCCGERMETVISVPPMISWTDPIIEPFRNPAAKRDDKDAVIMTTRQRREFMKKNDLVDANDFKPPSNGEQQAEVAKMKKSIEAITPTKSQSAMLRKSGLHDIV